MYNAETLFAIHPVYRDLAERGILHDAHLVALEWGLRGQHPDTVRSLLTGDGGTEWSPDDGTPRAADELFHVAMLGFPVGRADAYPDLVSAFGADMPLPSALDLVVYLIANPDEWTTHVAPVVGATLANPFIVGYERHISHIVDYVEWYTDIDPLMPFNRVVINAYCALSDDAQNTRSWLARILPFDPTFAAQLDAAYTTGSLITDRPLDRLAVTTLIRYCLMHDDYVILMPHDAPPTDRPYILYAHNLEYKIYTNYGDDPLDGDYDLVDMPDTVSAYTDAITALIGLDRPCGYLSVFGG